MLSENVTPGRVKLLSENVTPRDKTNAKLK